MLHSYIRELKQDTDLNEKVVALMSDINRFKSELNIAEQDIKIFTDLYNGATLSTIAEKYKISKERGRYIGLRVYVKCKLWFDTIRPDSLEVLGLSNRLYNSLRRANINSISDILEFKNSGKDFNDIRCIGKKQIAELREALKQRDIVLPDDISNLRIAASVVVYDKKKKVYKGYGNNWGSLDDAFIFRSEITASTYCNLSMDYELRDVRIVLVDNIE